MECNLPNCPCAEGSDEWKIEAPNYGNCFFNYFKSNKRPHTLQEIANLLGITLSAVTSTERKALVKLRKRLQQNIKDL